MIFPARYSRLDPDALVEILRSRWGFAEGVTCTFIHCGENDLYRVECGADTAYLRIYRRRFSIRERVVRELSLLDEIRASSAEVSGPIRTVDGQLLISLQAVEGERFAALFEPALGAMLSRNRVDGWEKFGAGLARLHTIEVAGIGLPRYSLPDLLEAPGMRWRGQLVGMGLDDRGLAEVIERLGNVMRKLWDGLPTGLVHGDTAGGNAHVDAEGRITFFDFLWTGFGPWCWDLGTFRRGAGEIDANWRAFRSGYEQVRRIEEQELTAVPMFAAIRCVFVTAILIDECLVDLQAECSASWLEGRLAELAKLEANIDRGGLGA